MSNRPSLGYIAAGLVAVSVFVLVGYSPIAGILIGSALIALLPSDRIWERRTLGLVIIFCNAIVYGSRQTFGTQFDDFSNSYYPNYLVLRSTDLFTHLIMLNSGGLGSSSVEVLPPLLLWLFAQLPFAINANALIAIITFIGGCFYYFWVERYLLRDLHPQLHGVMVVACLSLFSYGLCSQTMRQMWSIPWLLSALWEKTTLKRVLYLGLSTLFHFTSLPIGLMCLLLRRRSAVRFAVLLAGSFITLPFASKIPVLFQDQAAAMFDKAIYYNSDAVLEAQPIDRNYLVVMAFALCCAFACRNYKDGFLLRVTAIFMVFYVALLPLPFASFRTALFITGGLLAPLGVLAVTTATRGRMLVATALAIVAIQFMRRVFFQQEGTGMALWNAYPAAQLKMYYYFDTLLQIPQSG